MAARAAITLAARAGVAGVDSGRSGKSEDPSPGGSTELIRRTSMAIYRCEACGREKPGPPAPFCEGGEMTHRRATMKPRARHSTRPEGSLGSSAEALTPGPHGSVPRAHSEVQNWARACFRLVRRSFGLNHLEV